MSTLSDRVRKTSRQDSVIGVVSSIEDGIAIIKLGAKVLGRVTSTGNLAIGDKVRVNHIGGALVILPRYSAPIADSGVIRYPPITIPTDPDAPKTSGAGAFIGLSDAPSSYSGASKKTVAVKEDETGVEFVDTSLSADNVSVNADVFENNLSSADDTVQKALETIDLLEIGGGSSPNIFEPDAAPSSPSTRDDEFNDSSFDTSKWTEFDPVYNAITVTEDAAGLLITVDNDYSHFRGVYQSLPTGAWSIIAKASGNYTMGDGGWYGFTFGIGLWEDATDVTKKIARCGGHWYDQYGMAAFRQEKTAYNGPNTAYSEISDRFMATTMYYRIRYNGSGSYYFDYSTDGLSWLTYSGYFDLTFTPTHCGLFAERNDTRGRAASARFSFFRVRETFDAGSVPAYGRRI